MTPMNVGKIQSPVSLCVALAVLAACCKWPSVSSSRQPPCGIDPQLWQADACGTNGYRKQMGACLRLRSERKPVFVREADVLFYLGKPDTVYHHANSVKTFFYVVDGSPSCMQFFPDGVLESMSVYIGKSGKVESVSGGIH